MSQQDILDKAQALLKEGWNAAGQKDWSRAENKFADALQLGGQLDPTESDLPVVALLAMAQLSYERGKKEEAVERATSAFALSAETENFSGWQFPLYELMANLYDEMGAPQRAIPFRNVLARLWRELEGPDSEKTARACAILGESLEQLGFHEHAARAYGEAARAEPQYLRPWAVCLHRAGCHQEAEKAFQSLLEKERAGNVPGGDVAETLSAMGALYTGWGRLDDAMRCFYEAYRVHLARGVAGTGTARLKSQWAVALAKQGRLEEAAKTASEAVLLWGDSPERWAGCAALGAVAEASGDHEAAERHTAEALRWMDEHRISDAGSRVELLERRAGLLSRLGRVPEAGSARAEASRIAAARKQAPDPDALFRWGSSTSRD